MKLIGFNYTKILAQRKPLITGNPRIATGIEFISIDEEKIELLKEQKALRITFKLEILYQTGEEKKPEEQAKVSFEGSLLLAATPEEYKEVMKSWKKKELPGTMRITVFNIILAKCSVKALDLEEQLNLPLYPSLPQLVPQEKN